MDYTEIDDLRTAFSAPDERLANLLTKQKENMSPKVVTFMDTSLLPRFTFDAVKRINIRVRVGN